MSEQAVAGGFALQASDPPRLGDLVLQRRLRQSADPLAGVAKPMPFLVVPADTRPDSARRLVVKVAALPLGSVTRRCLDEEESWARAAGLFHARDADATHAWVAREFVEGTGLHRADRNASDGLRLTWSVWLLEEVARWHDAGRAHLDVKPSNVIVAESRAVLIDFESSHTVGSGVPEFGLGTPRFASPEQVTGRLDEVGTASDVFSWALTVCWLFESDRLQHPYAGVDASRERLVALDTTLRSGGGLPSPRLPSLSSPTLTDAVHRALEWNPAARPSAADLLAEFAPAGTEVLYATTVFPPSERPDRPRGDSVRGALAVLGPAGRFGDRAIDAYTRLVATLVAGVLGGVSGFVLALLLARLLRW